MSSASAQAQTLDFSDYTSFGSASSTVITTLKIGATTDKESAITANATATGDDITGSDDEDGVTVPASVALGVASSLTVNVTNTSGGTTYLNVWIDFNRNGVLTDTGEQVAVNTTIANNTSNSNRTVNFTVPATASVGVAGVRVRLTSTSGPGATGTSGNGEVEDYVMTQSCPTVTLSPATLIVPTVGTSYSQTITAAGSTTTFTYTVSAGTLPAGLSLNSATGALSGTPTSNATANFTITATGANTCVGSRAYTLTPVCPAITVSPATLTPGTVGTNFNTNIISASGGNAPYNFAVTAGTLPAGISLNSSNGNFAGTPTASNGAGTSITVTATDQNGCTGAITYNLKICPVVTLSPTSLPNGMVNSAYSQTISGVGGATPYVFAVASGALPAGLTLNASTGVISGRPTATTAASFTISATDANGCAGTQAYSVTPATATDLGDFASFGSASSIVLATLKIGTQTDAEIAATTNATATGDDITDLDDEDGVTVPASVVLGAASSLTVNVTNTSGAAANLNVWIDFNRNGVLTDAGEQVAVNTSIITGTSNSNRTVNFTVPANASPGAAGIRVRLTSTATPGATGASGNGEVEDWTLNQVCPVLTLSPATLTAGTVGTAYSQTFTTASGVSPYTYAVTSGTLPAGLTLSPAGVLNGTPTASNGAGTSITVTATDAVGCTASTTYNFKICPVITLSPSTLPNGMVNSAYSQAVSASGGATPYVYAVASGSLPAGLTLNSSSGVISGRPTATTAASFTISATDANGCAGTQAYTVTPATPTDMGDFASFGNASSIVLATLKIGTQTDAEITATTDATATGDDVTDLDDEDGLTVPASVTLGVASSMTVNVTNTSGVSAFLNVWIDFNRNGVLTDSGEQLAVNTAIATGTSNSNKIVNFTVPATASVGIAGVRVRLTSTSTPGATGASGNGEIEDAIMTLACPTVTITPTTPTVPTVGTAYSQTLTASGSTTTFTYAVSSGTLPVGLSLDANTGVLSGTPTSSAAATFTVTATGANTCVGSQAYTITPVCPTITVNPATLSDGLVGSSYSQTLSASGGTVPYTFTLTAGTLPAGLTLDASSGAITGTTTTSNAAGASLTFRATDANGCFGTRTVTLKVCPVISLSPATLSTPTVGTAYSQTITSSGGASPYTYALASGSLPSWATLSSAGVLSGTPNSTTTANFTVRSTDANGCSGTLAYTITPVCPVITVTPASLAQGTVGTAYSQTLTASGGTAPYGTWTVTSGTLPTGLTLNASTGVISGTPTAAASPATTISVSVNDTYGCQGSRSITLQICPVTTITPASLPIPTVGTAYSQNISASGGAGPYTFTLASGTLPTWATLGTDGLLSGTPTNTTPANFTVRATETNGCSATLAYNITPVCPTITITPASLAQGTVGTLYSQTLSASGGNAPYGTWTITSGALPAGLTLNASTGVISGTPTASASPSTTVTFRVNDTYGCQGTRSITMQICPVVTLAPVTPAAGTVGTAYSQTVSAAGGTAPYTFALVSGSLPPGLNLNAATGVVSGTPTMQISSNVTLRATDANSCQGTLSMTFAMSCPPITITPATLPQATVGSAYSQTLTASGGTASYTWAVTSGTLPAGLTLNPTTGVISGTPTTSNVAGASITITTTDSFNCPGTRTYTLQVCPVVTLSPATLATPTVGTAYSQTITASGGAAPYTYTLASGTLPTWATLSAGGVLSGTPNSTTAATFTVRATDANGCPGTLLYTVTPVCPAISITPTSLAQGTVSSPYSQTLAASGGTAPYGTWTVTSGTLPTGLTLNAGTGVISGTPTAAASPSTSITVRVNDTYGCQGSQVITLQICPVITITPASLTNGTVGTAYSQTVSASGGTAPYTFTVSGGSLPTWASLNANTGVISGTPDSITNASFTIRATDANGCAATRAYSVTPVCPVITPTPASLADGTVGTVYNQTITASGGTAPFTYAVTSGTLPAGLSLSTAGVLSGTPTTSNGLGVNVTIQATDTYGCQGALSYLIQICPVISLSPSSLPNGTAAIAYSQMITASGGATPYVYAVATGSLPAGLALNASTGVISGTPISTAAASFTLNATDANGCFGTRAYTITPVCPALTLTPATLPDGLVGSAYSQSISTSGGIAPYSYAVSSGTLPAGLTLSSAGLLSGTPTTSNGVGVNITIRSTDANGCQNTLSYAIQVCPVISLTPTTLPNGTVGSVYSQTATASGGATPYVYAISSGSLPAGLTLDGSTGVISGTPSSPSAANFTMTATDANGCAGSRAFTVTPAPNTDFGDLSTFASVSNTIDGTLKLGPLTDAEITATTNATATGDDITGSDDEDGATVPASITAGALVTIPVVVTNTNGTPAYLNAWIDFNNNASPADAGEQIASDVLVAAGTNGSTINLTFTVPVGASVGANRGLRVRLTSVTTPGFSGTGGMGEIEDYLVAIAAPTMDYGDYSSFTPASSTLLATLKIGALTDVEGGAATNATATSDDTTGSDDEDGVTMPANITQGTAGSMTVNVTNTSGASAYLNVWIDFNGNGDLTDAGEQVATNTVIATGTSNSNRTVSFTTLAIVKVGTVGVRTRLTSTATPGPDGSDGNGEVEDVTTNIIANTDFGDFSSFPSASSTSIATLRMGGSVDSEGSDATNATATGDDLDGTDDENGVTVPVSMAQGAAGSVVVNVTNTSGAVAYLNAWIDFNRNGVLTDAGEQIAVNTSIATGTSNANQTINFTAPVAASLGTAGVRVRLTSVITPTSVGLVGNGEVEDYVTTIALPTSDFGDELDFADAMSTASTALRLGALVDVEGSSTKTANSDGDDLTGSDDEDGLSFPSVTAGQPVTLPVTVTNTTGTAAFLNAWIDFNNNGSLLDAGEQIASDVSVANGLSNSVINLSFNVPTNAVTAATSLGTRFRITDTASPGPTGLDGIGEVEDHPIVILAPLTDFGDHSDYADVSNTASTNLRIGALVDTEYASTRNVTATGDDITGSDDEDGVTIPAMTAGAPATIPVTVTNNTGAGAFLNAWIDYNDNGVFGDPGEQIATNTSVANLSTNVVTNLNITVPATANTATPLGVRVRITALSSPGATGAGGLGEVEDYVVTVAAPTTDFGDFTSFGSASSTVVATVKLGALLDTEYVQTVNATATGDDITATDDEDSVTFPSMTAGAPATIPVLVTNTSGAAVFLNAWIDYNNNGSLADAGEQVATNVSIPTGSNNITQNLSITVPAGALTGVNLGARFRLTSTSGAATTGLVGNGEVEDYIVTITAPTTDFGDHSSFADASQGANPFLRMGALIDTEFVSTRNATATGDDITASDDEDGVVVPAMIAGQTVTIPVTISNGTGADGFLNAWIDFNNNGVLTDSGEQVAANILIATGAVNAVTNLSVTVPATATTGVSLGLRFRLSAPSGLGPTGINGLAGEVEDYVVTIAAPTTDFSDHASLADASSTQTATIKLGALTDTEFLSTRNATATGDDITGVDDEDGVTLPAMIAGAPATIPVLVTNTSGAAVNLNAWIDYNNNGSLADAGEQIASNVSIATGSNNITQNIAITVPATATMGVNLPVRVRLTSTLSPGPTGASGNGEVEDYIVNIASPTTDFGDFASFGSASNAADTTLRLGALIDAEFAATTNATATGDDITASDDEDGVTLPTIIAGQTLTVPVVVTNTTGAGAFLNAWIDFNNDGDVLDAGEQVITNANVANGSSNTTITPSVTAPATALTGVNVGVRFRLTTTAAPGATGAMGTLGEVEDYVISIAVPTTDFGDFTSFADASSTVVGTIKLGALTDVEFLATRNTTATGDDITGSDDEDAVTFPTLMAGAPATIPVLVTNTSGAAVNLNAWIDYNNNGTLEAGEQIATNVSIPTGSNNITQNLNITVPADALPVTNLGARFRLTSTATPGATGVSGNGEVEDYVVSIANPPLDYGDSSVLGSASSTASATLFLGTAMADTEFVPTLNATASGDDNTGIDDEDGVNIPTLTAGAPGTITVTATNTTGAAAFLNAWIDFNNDGDVLDASEQIATNTNVATGTSNGSIPLNFTVPATAVTGANLVLRFRLTSTSTPGITGTSGNGEVEDYVTTLAVPTTDFGDWNGAADASSIASSNLRMGSFVDTEYVSTRNAAATGDDITGSDDEDGVTLAASYNLSAISSATVATTNVSGTAAYLNAWIDFNNNGSFADAGEQVATNTLVANGTNGVTQTINFTVPAAAIPGQRGMRVRFTDVQNPTPVGAAGVGEVEDTLLTINCPTITLSPTTVPNGTVGAAYSQTITSAGGTGPYSYAVSAGALPSGITLSTGGLLSGTLTSASVANFTLRATDANGCTGIQAYTFTPVCLPISISPTTATQGLINTAYTQTLSASGGTAPYGAWTVTAGTLPTGLTLNAATGVISGNPTVAASPATSITVRTTDAYGCQGTQVISLQICPAITITPASPAAGTVGTAYTQTLTATGGTGPYTWSTASGTFPTGLSLSTSGVVSGLPTAAMSNAVTVRATDANGCATTLALTFAMSCPAITINPASVTAAFINTAYTQTITPSAGTAPFVFAVASGALPTGLALDSSTGVISGTPTTSATATFTIRATDTYGCFGTSASYSITPAPSIDFGDLSTLTSASSIRDTTVKMGALVDYEYTQTANATATGDDITGTDDEDGVTLPVGLIQGQTGLSVTVNLTNTSGAETYLNGWIDFNNNGVLTDAGEQIVFNDPVADGTNAANRTLTFNVPSVAAVATVGVRFRLTSIASPGSTGASGAGEVEDYTVGITQSADHGDFSLFQDASSNLSSTLMMGDFTDAEFTAFTNLAATGDDLNNINDEDGTTVPAIMVRGQAGVTVTVNLTNLSGAPAYLNGYADFNNNGVLTDTDEQILTNIVVPTGTSSDYQTFFFDVPATATLGTIGLRFRLTSVSNPGPVGASGNGEVEDYTATIVVPSSNFRDYFYALRHSGTTWYLDEISVYNPASSTPTVSITQGILNMNTATPGFNAGASNAFMNGLALDWLNRRFYWNSTSSGSTGYNFQLNTAYYDNVTKTWSSQAVTGSNLSNIPFDTGTPNSSSSGSGAFPRAAYYAGDYYGGGQNNDNMVAWRLNSAGTGLNTPAFNDYPNFFHLTQKFGGGDFVIRPQDGLLITSTAVNNNTNTLFNHFMADGFNPTGPAATSVSIESQIPVASNSAIQIAGVGGVTRMYGVAANSAKVYRLDNYDTASPIAVSVGNLPTASGTAYDDLSEGISSSVTSLGVKGIVYEDTNGLTNSTVDGIGSNAGGTLFAMLVDGAGNMLDSFPVKDDGTFILGGAVANTAYTVVLSTSAGSLGGAAPVADLPAGWMNTGEFLGSGAGSDGTVNGRLAVSVVNNGLVNAKFGISQTVSAGNLVWNDANNNGLKDTTESGISGVVVQLWTPGSDNAIGGTGLAADTLVASSTTTGSGIYGFTNQLPGKYFICLTPPALYSFASSTVVTLDNGVDNDNNGAQPGGRATQVYSPIIDLAVGKEPGNLATGGIDIDNTIDFGLLTAMDFGDYSLFGSASSALVSNLFVGTLIDAEYTATTDVTATGDNLTGLNDEDGVTTPAVVQGAAGSMTVRVTNTSGSSAFMNVWIDYNNNGVLTDAGEQVATNTLIANGTSNATRTVNLTAPATAYIGNVGVRVRLTSTNSPGSVGSSGNGEVEDHLIQILSPIDYGDFVSFASAGSTKVNTLFMGTLVDTEPVGIDNATATGDDLDGTDDEDGATVPATMTLGAPGTITINVTNNSAANARLSVWLDFNRNGVLTDAGEQIANDLVVNKSTIGANQVINFTVPLTASVGTAGVRMRLTDQNNAASVGIVGNGEVEDYVTSIVLPTTDFGDWSGAADASSIAIASLRIGTLTDTEYVSTLNATATGDDTTGSDDEDGVTLAASYTPAVAGTATVVTTNTSGAAAYLNAWIDYNNNGSFADAGEQIATNTLVATGTNGIGQTINFTPPITAIPGQRGARFRFTSVTNPTSIGAAGSGEVEDVMVTINCPIITVTTASLAVPTVGASYSQTIAASGGSGALVFSINPGALPSGLTLNAATGVISGTPTNTTSQTFTIRATDINGCLGSQAYTLTPLPNTDFGDWNGAGAQTTTASSLFSTNLRMGATVDAENTATTNATATGDDITNTGSADDEDGVTMPASITAGASTTIPVSVFNNNTAGRQLQAWIDFDNNGTFNNVDIATAGGERIYNAAVPANAAQQTVTINFTAPMPVSIGTQRGVRFRFTDSAATTPTSTGANGEIEDYIVSIVCPTITLTPTLPTAYLGGAYSQTITASGGRAAYTYTVQSGALPTGLSLATSGAITGTPTASGAFTATVLATDANGCTTTLAYTIVVRTFSVGNLVFEDTNNNGVKDSGEPGVTGALVQLFNPGSDNAIGGTAGAADTQVGSDFTTTATGAYLFSALPAGNYFVKVTSPAIYALSGGTPATTDNDVDNNNDGSQPGGSGTPLFSPVFNLTGGAESITDGDTDTETNLTIDFGLWNSFSVGNVVFIDFNNDGAYDEQEGVEGVYVQIYTQGSTPGVTAPVGAAITDHKGRFLIEGLNPVSHFLHLPASQFATGMPLNGLVPMTSAIAGDDNVGQDLLTAATPATTGASTAVFSLRPGLCPAGAAESGFEGSTDDATDASVDLTRDLGLIASGGGFANGMSVTRTLPATTTTTTLTTTFAQWSQTSGIGASGADPDADGRTNLLEYALGTNPQSGADLSRFAITQDNVTGTLSAVLTRPADGREDLRFTLEATADLVQAPWQPLALAAAATFNADGTVTRRYADIDQAALFAGVQTGFIRLKVELDADRNGTAEATTTSTVQAWSRQTFATGTRTFSMPLLKPALFIGRVSSVSGNELTLPVSIALTSGSYFLEVLDGTLAGQRFEIDATASSSSTLTLQSTNAAITGSRIAIRPHHTLSDLLPADLFTAGSTSNEADRALFFDTASNAFSTLWLSSSGWTHGTLSMNARPFAPHEAAMVQVRGTEITRTFTGEVRSTDFALPLSAGTQLIATGWPVDLAAPVTGLRSGITADAADRLRLWNGDTTPDSSSYTSFYLDSSSTPPTWHVQTGESTAPPLQSAFHGLFLIRETPLMLNQSKPW